MLIDPSVLGVVCVRQVAVQQQPEEAERGTQPAAQAARQGGAPSAGDPRRAAQSTGGAAQPPVPQIRQVIDLNAPLNRGHNEQQGIRQGIRL